MKRMRKKISILMLIVLVTVHFTPEYLLAKTEEPVMQNVNSEELEQKEQDKQKEESMQSEPVLETEESATEDMETVPEESKEAEEPEMEKPIQSAEQSDGAEENLQDAHVEKTNEIKAYYEPGYELNIEGKDIHFKIETPPEENGTLVVKLPPFFELTSTPSSQDEYTVSSSKEKIDADDPTLGTLLGGEVREVLTFRYKEVTSTVNISFEMKQKEWEKKDDGTSVEVAKLLTQAMIRAGEHPDQIPLNIDIALYDKDQSLLKEKQIQGTSKLSKENEMMFKFQGKYVGYDYDETNFWNKGVNELYLSDPFDQNKCMVSVGEYHYPYTDVELMIPVDKGGKLNSFNDNAPYLGEEWEKIETETYNGVNYFVGNYNDKKGNYGHDLQQYNRMEYLYVENIRLIYGEEIQPKETLWYDSPVLLRYTYKGKTEVKELYRIDEWRVGNVCLPQVFWKNSNWKVNEKEERKVLCGEPVNEMDFHVYNSYYDQVSLERKNLVLEVDYPYEVQPQKIRNIEISNGEKKEFDIVYTVVDSISKAEKDISEINVSAGYKFKLKENEYVSKIKIIIPKMEKKDHLRFDTDNLTTTRDKDGNDIIEDKTVRVKGSLYMDGSKINDGFYDVHLQALKDQLRGEVFPSNPIMEDDNRAAYRVAEIAISAPDRYTKNYEQVSLQFNAPEEIMSKVIGFYIRWNVASKALEGDVAVVYDTNLKKNQSVSIQEKDIEMRKYLPLDLKEGEYVTNIRLDIEKMIGGRMCYIVGDGSLYFAPVIDTKRTYYDGDGLEKELLFDHDYKFSYKFSTKSLPAVNMTEEKLSGSEQYKGYMRYVIENFWSPDYYIRDINDKGNVSSGYRGDTVLCQFDLQNMNSIHNDYRYYDKESSYYIDIKENYYFEGQLFYLEVLPGFEATGLTTPSVLERKEKLENGNNLYVFRLTAKAGKYPMRDPIQAKLYIRPDAKTEACNPIVGAGYSLEQYFEKYFPDYPECEKEKKTFPYQFVQLSNERYNKFPENWKLSDGEKMYGVYYSYTKPENSEAFTVRNVTTSTTQMLGKVSGLLQEDDVTFKEAQRETLGFSAFISASSNETVNDYTATFCIPEKGDVVQGEDKTYRAQYTLYGNGPMEVYLNGNAVNLSECGIKISYYDKSSAEVNVADGGNWDEVRQVKVHFDSLNNETVYELSMPLKTDAKAGEDISDWKSYIGSYNQTGKNGEPTYITPLTYVYQSYRVDSYFGLDKYESGSPQYFPINRKLIVYDENWGEIFVKELKANDSYSVSQKFNAGGKKIAYIGFELEEGEWEHYLPTLKKSTSDLPEGEENIHEFSDGRKIWYIAADEMDFVSDSMGGKYDALFIRKPEITAKDLHVAVGKSGKLDFSVAQPMNEELVKKYKISVRLSEQDETSQKIAQITQKEDGYYAEGLEKGTVSYEVIVTNTQGMRFTQKANITVGDQLYALLPHVGGWGSEAFAYAGILFIGGGAVVLLQKRKKRCH